MKTPPLQHQQMRESLRDYDSQLKELNRRAPAGLWRNCTIPFNSGVTTPLKAATTDPNLGIGSTSFGRYCRMGDLVAVFIDIQFGAFSTPGTGTYQIQLPFKNSTKMTGTYGSICSARLQDNSTGNVLYTTGSTINAGTINLVLRYQAAWPVGADTSVTNTTPWTWADLDRLSVHVLYEAEPY